jgi:hypothetical protein
MTERNTDKKYNKPCSAQIQRKKKILEKEEILNEEVCRRRHRASITCL